MLDLGSEPNKVYHPLISPFPQTQVIVLQVFQPLISQFPQSQAIVLQVFQPLISPFPHSFYLLFIVRKMKTISPHWDYVEAPCEYASHCGGCKTQNLSYETQLKAKEQQERNELPEVGFRAAVAIPEWHSRERSWGLDRNDQVSAEKSKTVVKFPLSRAHLISFLNKIWVHINRSLRVIHSTWSGAIKWISTLGNQTNDAQVTYLADKFCIKENIRRFQVPMDKTRAAGMQKDKSRTYLNSNSNPILPMKEARSCLGEKVIFKVAIVKMAKNPLVNTSKISFSNL
nr:uncharacterized RNA methyltransferase BH0687 [Ipomoea batatas]